MSKIIDEVKIATAGMGIEVGESIVFKCGAHITMPHSNGRDTTYSGFILRRSDIKAKIAEAIASKK